MAMEFRRCSGWKGRPFKKSKKARVRLAVLCVLLCGVVFYIFRGAELSEILGVSEKDIESVDMQVWSESIDVPEKRFTEEEMISYLLHMKGIEGKMPYVPDGGFDVDIKIHFADGSSQTIAYSVWDGRLGKSTAGWMEIDGVNYKIRDNKLMALWEQYGEEIVE